MTSSYAFTTGKTRRIDPDPPCLLDLFEAKQVAALDGFPASVVWLIDTYLATRHFRLLIKLSPLASSVSARHFYYRTTLESPPRLMLQVYERSDVLATLPQLVLVDHWRKLVADKRKQQLIDLFHAAVKSMMKQLQHAFLQQAERVRKLLSRDLTDYDVDNPPHWVSVANEFAAHGILVNIELATILDVPRFLSGDASAAKVTVKPAKDVAAAGLAASFVAQEDYCVRFHVVDFMMPLSAENDDRDMGFCGVYSFKEVAVALNRKRTTGQGVCMTSLPRGSHLVERRVHGRRGSSCM